METLFSVITHVATSQNLTAIGLIMDIAGAFAVFICTSVNKIEAEISYKLVTHFTDESQEWAHDVSFEEHKREVTWLRKMLKRNRRGLRSGIILVILGFFFQLIAVLDSTPEVEVAVSGSTTTNAYDVASPQCPRRADADGRLRFTHPRLRSPRLVRSPGVIEEPATPCKRSLRRHGRLRPHAHLLESDLLQGLELGRQASKETRVDPAGTDEEPLRGRPASHHRIGSRALRARRGVPSDSPQRAQDQKTVFKIFAVPATKSSISSRVGSLSLAWSQMFRMSARS